MKKLLCCLIALTQTHLFSTRIDFYTRIESKFKNEEKYIKLTFNDTDTFAYVIKEMKNEYFKAHTTYPTSITYKTNGSSITYDALQQTNLYTLTLLQIGLTNTSINIDVTD